ncbi:hypothetical protein K493DRAFT_278381 [Basidiobolus meristosporus CBS 931.73]|uniref:DUF590-domain-containing protein n=1 Tax=Basidiobolus meristosporus CBS 931.73 TaxID=1314790 RepID=A0A1Y1YT43_9FUNG|nr:hypothetical protein K493DRAFT_278381 [Basidiobolus meristosporus CBS 931.73]|eukprot:ORY00917.1 hypothetical protein K493DRAFT_278381 [Basidiobolus meristosporus CBS 931.73]
MKYHKQQIESNPTDFFADFVIVFRYPTPRMEATPAERVQLEENVMQAFRNMLERIENAGLMCEVRKGDPKSLLIFILCPKDKIYTKYRLNRVNDWLAGLHITGKNYSKEASEPWKIINSQIPTTAERHRVEYQLLTGPVAEGNAGVIPGESFVESVFPLHNRKFNEKWLMSWGTTWQVSKNDLTQLRDEFGEKVAFYFAFLKFYFVGLVPLAAIGLVAYFFSINFSIILSLLTCIWSVFFLASWSWKERNWAARWSVSNCRRVEEFRPQFKSSDKRYDQITGKTVYYFPHWKRWLRKLLVAPLIVGFALALLSAISTTFFFEFMVREYYHGPFKKFFKYTSVAIYSVSVPHLTKLYRKFAMRLNDFENYATETKYHSNLTYKIFINSFFLTYVSVFLVAWVFIPFGDDLAFWIKNRFALEHFDIRFGPSRLITQIMLTIHIKSLVSGFFIPIGKRALSYYKRKIKSVVRRHQGREDADQQRFIDSVIVESKLPDYDIYGDFVDMTTQFGSVCLFTSVWPLAPLAVLACVWVETRSDAVKICFRTKRPIPIRAESIGPWKRTMEFLAWLGTIVNTLFLYQFRNFSDMSTDPHTWENLDYMHIIYAAVIAVISEHLFLVFRATAGKLISSIPSWVDTQVQQETQTLKEELLKNVTDAELVNQKQTSVNQEKLDIGAEQQYHIGVAEIRSEFKNL